MSEQEVHDGYAEFVCGGCGKRERGVFAAGRWYKPYFWFERGYDAGDVQIACSRECIEKIARKTGKTSIVKPI